MDRDLDRIDALVAAGLAAGISLWAFVWAEPYPHPDLWPFLVALRSRVSLTVLGCVGKLGLGVFSALVYLVLRGAWIRYRHIEDEFPDGFFFTRFAPLCGTTVFALSPFVWRHAQFLSPGFGLVLVASVAVFLWQRGCGYRCLTAYFLAYAAIGFVSGINPLGLVLLAYVVLCDALRRWRDGLRRSQREDDADAKRKRLVEFAISSVGVAVGFVLAIGLNAVWMSGCSLVQSVFVWWRDWPWSFVRTVRTPEALALVGGVGLAVASLAFGRRLREPGRRNFKFAVLLSAALACVAVFSFMRAVDADERLRLGFIRDYVQGVVRDAEGVEWLFTDGRLDDALRFELNRQGRSVRMLDVLDFPSSAEMVALRALAPESGEADVFAAGGAEVFKAWARERPDRLDKAAWQVGTSVVRRFGKTEVRTSGSVMRTASVDTAATCDEADRRFKCFARDLLRAVGSSSTSDPWLGSVDKAVSERFDAVMWRVARLAGEHAAICETAADAKGAKAARQAMQVLDGANGSLRVRADVAERLRPTARLVLTSREALDVALKRADFALAERYAHEVLVSAPNDASAHFALGMARLEAGAYREATRHLERVLQEKPNEPASLNNLALAYLKLGDAEKARSIAEKALKIHPNSAEIKKNLDLIRNSPKK